MRMKHFEPYVEYRSKPAKVALNTRTGETKIIEISAGSSFGAAHQTTIACLKCIEDIYRTSTPERVLDFGCGSGILAIAAQMLGAQSVLAIDIDPLAVDEARKNVEINGAENIQLLNASIEDVSGKFDLVIANIIRDKLIQMAEDIKRVAAEKGMLLVSGISDDRKDTIISRFSELGFIPQKEFIEKGWVAIFFVLG